MSAARDTGPLAGLSVLERGWLSSNNIVLHGDGGGAWLIDTGHVSHAEQTVALVRHALRGEPLARIVNTHLHSDHCGGNAALQRAFGCGITIPPGQWEAVRDWDEAALSYATTEQRCERFVADARLAPGEAFVVGRRRWHALAAPGHDPHSLILFDEEQRVVLTADALWERGFGIVFPELDGDSGFDEVAATLDLIESLDARCAIPGHGAPFGDLAGAIDRARQRLASFRADPDRHARHAIKVLIKFHLLEVRRQDWPSLCRWFEHGTLYPAVWRRLGRPEGSLIEFARRLVDELVAAGALARDADAVVDA